MPVLAEPTASPRLAQQRACDEAVARLARTFAPVLPRPMPTVPAPARHEAVGLYVALRIAGRRAPYAAALVGYLYHVSPATVAFWYSRSRA